MYRTTATLAGLFVLGATGLYFCPADDVVFVVSGATGGGLVVAATLLSEKYRTAALGVLIATLMLTARGDLAAASLTFAWTVVVTCACVGVHRSVQDERDARTQEQQVE